MDEQTFVETSKETWDRLGASVQEARRAGVTRLGAQSLRQLYEDYRHTAADLAYAQTHFPSSRIEIHLNQLVGQAHAELYGSSPRRLRGFLHFIAVGYPVLVRKYWRPVVLSALLLFGAAALGFLFVYINYPLARLFLPAQFRDGIGDSIAQGADARAMMVSFAPVLSAGITVNNLLVALQAFAGGMTFGVLTVYALVTNGLLLGALAGIFTQGGEALSFWSLIIPHGSLELPAIALAGAGGLLLARALISPGDLPRTTALKEIAPDAMKIVLGAVPLFIIAGIIEAFFTPTAVDATLKVVFGVLATALMLAYILLPGRGSTSESVDEADEAGAT